MAFPRVLAAALLLLPLPVPTASIPPVPVPSLTGSPAPAPAVVYRPPLPGAIIRHFEPPPTPYSAGHRGIDIAAPSDSIVRAAAAGRVAFAGPVGGSVAVSIDHPDGIRTTYSYLASALVRAGGTVARGDPIARSGTGHPDESGEAHVHVGARRGETYIDVEALIVDSLRRDHAGLVRLAPDAG
ncbi:MAG TPA: M23 family metallopeptidase [Actinomycetota bacterium]